MTTQWSKLFNFTDPQNVASFASILSFVFTLLSLLITLLVLFKVRRINRYFSFKVRIPAILDQLIKKASELSDGHKNFDANQAKNTITVCHAHLRSLQSKLSGDPKRSACNLIASMEPIMQSSTIISDSDAWRIYTKLNGLIQEVKNWHDDKNLEYK